MNAARITAVFEELAALDTRRAELQRELAALLGGVERRVVVPPPKTPRRRQARPAIVAPQDVTELDVHRAKQIARRRGISVG